MLDIPEFTGDTIVLWAEGDVVSLLSKKRGKIAVRLSHKKVPNIRGKSGGDNIPLPIFPLLLYPVNAKSAHVPHRSL